MHNKKRKQMGDFNPFSLYKCSLLKYNINDNKYPAR